MVVDNDLGSSSSLPVGRFILTSPDWPEDEPLLVARSHSVSAGDRSVFKSHTGMPSGRANGRWVTPSGNLQCPCPSPNEVDRGRDGPIMVVPSPSSPAVRPPTGHGPVFEHCASMSGTGRLPRYGAHARGLSRVVPRRGGPISKLPVGVASPAHNSAIVEDSACAVSTR